MSITDDRIAREDASEHASPARNGHLPTLIACFLHFDLSFMLWVLLGALGIFISESVGLTPVQKGLVVAVPLLSGSLLRVPAGMLSDRLGAKRVGIALLALLYIPLVVGWTAGDTLPSLLVIGLLLGTAGASFAVALPLASRWYPAEKQGLAMGVAAAGNSGTVITNMIAPTLAAAIGWRNVFAVALIPLTLVLISFLLLAKESPREPGRASTVGFKDLLAALAKRDLWSFCLFYSVTFGGYVGLSSFLPLLLRDQYGLAAVSAGQVTALVALAGSVSRPFGGWVADRMGGVRILMLALAGISIVYGVLSRLPGPTITIPVLFFGMCCLGLGNGAVFQLVPQRFQREIGTATGVIGAVGGLGGFFLPTLLGAMKQSTGSYAPAFMVMATVAGCAALSLRHSAKTRWKVVAYTHQ
jgi:MFS transporter, NNP family, nitrate/nitrite transporter